MSNLPISQQGKVGILRSAAVNIPRLILVAEILGTIPPLGQEKHALYFKGVHGKVVHIEACEKSPNH